MEKKEIGRVSHYFGKPQVAAIVLTDGLKVGDTISIQGHTTDFEQEITSMQIMHQDVSEAGSGDDVGVKVQSRARRGDRVYKVT